MPIIVERGSARPDTMLLKAMFADRKSVFVDLLKWDLPVLEHRFELDGFDDPHASYVIVADEHAHHLGSARLLPTTRPHILKDLFPDLCAAEVPSGADTFEITRFCLSRRQSSAERRRTRNRLVSGLVAHALRTGIRTYTGVAELAWLQQILAFGWKCRPLGAPIALPCGLLGALAIDIEADTPDRLAANGIWDADEPARVAEAA